jgi:hypothetical protein
MRTRAPLGGALYARKCFFFFSKDEENKVLPPSNSNPPMKFE